VGTSSDEIEREITSTRERLDENLDVLERRAASGARRVAVIVAIGAAAGLVVAGVALIVYRRRRRPSLGDRLQDILPDALTGLPDEVRSRLRHRPFKVVITEAGAGREPGMWESIGRKVAPALVSTAVGTVVSRALRRTSEASSPEE
jgi:hypothetical protein